MEGICYFLYLVNEIVTASGGKIILKSELGKGAEFQVYLSDIKKPASNTEKPA